MANNAWDRQIVNTRERPRSGDLNTLQAQLDRTIRETVMRLFQARDWSNDKAFVHVPGFIGDGLKVREPAAPGMAVVVREGLGFYDLPGDVPAAVSGVDGLDDLSPYKPLPLMADTTISSIPTCGAQPRIDIVEVRLSRVPGNPLSRDVLNTGTGVFDATSVNKTLAFSLDGSVGIVTDPSNSTAAISYKVGTPGATPAAPAGTPGYITVANVVVPALATAITRGMIIDRRLILHMYGMMPFAVKATIPTGLTSPPTNVLPDVPPGVEVVVVKDTPSASPGTNNRFSVWVIGGDFGAYRKGNMDGQAVKAAYSATETLSVQTLGTVFGALSSGDVASLANANTSTPALAFAVGASYMKTSFYVLRQAGGTTDTAVPDPMTVDMQGFLHRY